ncbi:MAG TPA: radical SAM protein [Motilibacterales bacterium]|nr:radical SAM protein [Motilibacterales bacterium]
MPTRVWAELGWFGLTTVVRHRTDPIIGSLILTDRCNLHCQHCAVGNIRRVDYPWQRICADLHALRGQGVRVLFLYGGEPFLWHEGGHGLRDVVREARAMGFVSINVVTNGTRGLDLPEADVILVSVDGTRAHHDQIRGPSYDRIMESIEAAPADNLCLYMAINRINLDDIEHVARLARELPHVRAGSYNLHTPYPGTEHLTLTRAQRRDACDRIAQLIRAGYPVLNLLHALPRIADLATDGPCHRCVIVEDGQQWTCGRCIEEPGLCAQCGFLFAGELSQLFAGDPRVILDAVRTYGRLLQPARRWGCSGGLTPPPAAALAEGLLPERRSAPL